MINHLSIGVKNPERVANVVAELWNGYAFPFPPSPDSFIVFADDGRGTAIEFTPVNIELLPGDGYPSEKDFSIETLTEEFEGSFQFGERTPEFISTHIAINSPLTEAEIKAIGRREGWRTLTCNRGGGMFQLIEIWVENRFMVEVFTPEMTARYIEIATPESWANFLQVPFAPRAATTANNLNLIG